MTYKDFRKALNYLDFKEYCIMFEFEENCKGNYLDNIKGWKIYKPREDESCEFPLLTSENTTIKELNKWAKERRTFKWLDVWNLMAWSIYGVGETLFLVNFIWLNNDCLRFLSAGMLISWLIAIIISVKIMLKESSCFEKQLKDKREVFEKYLENCKKMTLEEGIEALNDGGNSKSKRYKKKPRKS